ncbi:hypothetical protein [Pseudofrankia sp. EUN1h]|uniref:hypothetical protein n=1 Tax=Pseudofrankia sp. EUN1h TaxID=1834515 RepID=UPI0002F35042|nr:hypothetical protein [Pseudofrankia sp. EUN1h]
MLDDTHVHGAPPHGPVGNTDNQKAVVRFGQNGRTGRLLAQIDLTKVLVVGELAAAGTVIAVHLFDHLDSLRGGPRARIQMGPGGWVSMRGGATKIRTSRATASAVSRSARNPGATRQNRPSPGARGPKHIPRAIGHLPRGYRTGRQPGTDRADSGRRPWWAVLIGAKPVETR